MKHWDIVDQVKKLFTKFSSDPTTAAQLVAKDPAYFTGSEVGRHNLIVRMAWFSIPSLTVLNYFLKNQVRIIDDDVPLAQFAVAFQGASWTDPDSIPLMVMQAMLGSWNKSAGGGKHMG